MGPDHHLEIITLLQPMIGENGSVVSFLKINPKFRLYTIYITNGDFIMKGMQVCLRIYFLDQLCVAFLASVLQMLRNSPK